MVCHGYVDQPPILDPGGGGNCTDETGRDGVALVSATDGPGGACGACGACGPCGGPCGPVASWRCLWWSLRSWRWLLWGSKDIIGIGHCLNNGVINSSIIVIIIIIITTIITTTVVIVRVVRPVGPVVFL